jgi:hypothetical protein
VIKIDKALSAEIKRGLERNKALQVWAEEQLAATTAAFASRLEERAKEARERVEVLRSRVDTLEEFFTREKERTLAVVEEKSGEVSKTLAELQEAMDGERRERLEREGRLLRQLGEHEQEVSLRFEQERTSREGKCLELRQGLETFERTRKKMDHDFQMQVSEQLAGLREAMANESMTRANEDAEIVEALGRYTEKLQHSLKIINASAGGGGGGNGGGGGGGFGASGAGGLLSSSRGASPTYNGDGGGGGGGSMRW